MATYSNQSFVEEERQRFRRCSFKLQSLVPDKDRRYRDELNRVLDELNSLDYSISGLIDQDPNRLLCQACVLVPLEDELLVTKVCQLVVIITHQKVTLSQPTVETLLEYIVAATKQKESWALSDTLRALGAVVYENGTKCTKFLDQLLSSRHPEGLLLRLSTSTDINIKRASLQCIGNLCMRCSDGSVIALDYLKSSLKAMLSALRMQKLQGCDEYEHYRILLSALRGLQNILAASKDVHHDQLGVVLATMKGYMLYGLPGIGTTINVPSTLYPSSLFQYDVTASPPKSGAPTKGSAPEQVSLRPGGGGGGGTPKTSHSKKSKKKKQRGGGNKQQQQQQAGTQGAPGREESNKSSAGTTGNQEEAQGGSNLDVPSLWPAWGRVSSSESEYSDTEGGQASKLRSATAKIRQAALACLHATVKNTEKRLVFGYWSAFIPDAPAIGKGNPHSQTLFTSMLKDPAPKVRVGSVVVLGSFLDGSKQFLAAADDRTQNRQAFTPFTSTLASTIKEIHRSLLLALVAEPFSTTLTQLIKCLSILVQNVPYHKLCQGLLTKIIKALRPYFSHKDNNVRTACLTCMGAILSNNSPLAEITNLLLTYSMPTTTPSHPGSAYSSPRRQRSEADEVLDWRKGTRVDTDTQDTTPRAKDDDMEKRLSGLHLQTGADPERSRKDLASDFSQTQSSEDLQHRSSGGMHDESKQAGKGMAEGEESRVPWLVKWCGHVVLDEDIDMHGSSATTKSSIHSGAEALPVKLEALQVLTQLVKGYFLTVRHILDHICNIILCCLQDQDPSIQLHALKVLESFGKGMLQHEKSDTPSLIPTAVPDVLLEHKEVVAIWSRLLSGSVPGILQEQDKPMLQASACDCISTIGPHTLEHLTMDKRILCITLLLGLSNDEDYRVKASAIRALGVYVLYPCLREDVMFVADTANAVLNSLKDSSVNVRMRAAWSLGNLSDALIANKDSQDTAFMEEFSDLLLQKLLEAATKGSGDHDKVKSNAVRAVGMLIQYARPQALAKPGFQTLIQQAIQALVRNITTGAVKVRWNACYAISNVYRNSDLDVGSASWSAEVFKALTGVVRDCKNFKVRINGALALSIPDQRCSYGNTEQFCLIWGSLTEALEVIDQFDDASELKYRDTLRDQLCCTASHLCTLLECDDLLALGKVLKDKEEMIEKNMSRYAAAYMKQHGTDSVPGINEASSHLEDLSQNTSLHQAGINALVLLQSVFKTSYEEIERYEEDN